MPPPAARRLASKGARASPLAGTPIPLLPRPPLPRALSRPVASFADKSPTRTNGTCPWDRRSTQSVGRDTTSPPRPKPGLTQLTALSNVLKRITEIVHLVFKLQPPSEEEIDPFPYADLDAIREVFGDEPE
jgi:hypothetical protein